MSSTARTESAGEGVPELTVVIPVYNEAPRIGAVIHSWARQLDGLAIDYVLQVYDDGSTDGTADALARIEASVPRLRITHHPNRGHGPTILRGYREARGRWVLQVDGDGEIDARSITAAWPLREEHDMVIGFRRARRLPPARRLLSWSARLVVRMAFATRLRDVNCPFRLMRRDRLRDMLNEIPDQTFAPNVALAGLAHAAGLRVVEVAVETPPSGRADRRGHANWHVYRGAARAMFDTVRIAARRGRRQRRSATRV